MDALPVAIVLAVLLAACLWGWMRSVARWRRRLAALDGLKRSQSTRYGQITEQFAPFLPAWPWDPKGFRFLGSPVDGVQFTDDAIVFVEVKAADGRLTDGQRRVRELVASGKVRYEVVRVG